MFTTGNPTTKPVMAFTNLGQDLLAAAALGDLMALVEDDRVEQVHLQGGLHQRLDQGSVSHDDDIK